MSVCYIKGTCIINTLNFGGRHDSQIVQARAPYTVSDRQTRVTVAVRGRHPPRPVWVHQTVDSQANCLPLCVKQTGKLFAVSVRKMGCLTLCIKQTVHFFLQMFVLCKDRIIVYDTCSTVVLLSCKCIISPIIITFN